MSKRIWNRIKREGLINEIRRLRVKSLFLKNDVYNSLGLKSINKDSSPKYVKSFYGPLMLENWQDVTFRFCIRGSYGTVFSDYLKNYTKPFCFIDIGANQGLYSLVAGMNPNCIEIYAFEPIPSTANILKKNLDFNGLYDRSNVYVKAVSNKTGRSKISFNAEHTGHSGLDRHNQKSGCLTIETVDWTFLDNLHVSSDADVIVKIDVEGHERTVIKQLVKVSFLNSIKSIYYECNEKQKEEMSAIRNTLAKKKLINCIDVKDEETKNVYNILCKKN
jgi:FkbM family methyltransferase